MAIDRNKTKDLISGIDELVEVFIKNEKVKKFIKESIMGPAIKEIEELVKDSRPPKMYLLGRSGHGKSSLINALANKKVAKVGEVKPTTSQSEVYEIVFEDVYSTWNVIDSRGLFETTSPEGGERKDVTEIVIDDIKKYNPDIILHIVAGTEARNMSNDFEVLKEIYDESEKKWGVKIPMILVLSKVDTLGNPREWPPEKFPKKLGEINKLLDYMKEVIKHQNVKKIDFNYPFKGYSFEGSNYLGVFPVSTLENELWNIETLSDYIGEHLPKEAQLDFFQAQKRKGLLRKVSSSIIKRFATIAAGIGASPIPISDIAVLLPLQYLMIAIIGGLSCRPFKRDTAFEYLSAMGINTSVGFGARFLVQQLLKIFPGYGDIVSGGLASIITYSIGKSAEAYFFAGEKREYKEFMKEAKKETEELKE